MPRARWLSQEARAVWEALAARAAQAVLTQQEARAGLQALAALAALHMAEG